MMTKTNLFLKSLILLGMTLVLAACDSGGGGGGGSTGPQTILVIGDSISGEENYPGVPPWPTLMAGMVPEWTVINQAESGESMIDGRSAIDNYLAKYSPDTVVIFYGSNNAITGKTTFFESDLIATIQACEAANAKVFVCSIPYMYDTRAIYNGRVDVVNSGVKSATSQEKVPVININGEFGSNSGDLFPDGLHPNLDGQRIIAVSVREKL